MNTDDGTYMMRAHRVWFFTLWFTLLLINLAKAREPEIWFEPPDPVSQHVADYPALFDAPSRWPSTAAKISVFVMTARYITTTPEQTIRGQLEWLRSHGIKLGVAVLAMPVDKKICGNGVEGMVWTNEPAAYAKKFRNLGTSIDYFLLDSPLSSGHIYAGAGACRFSVDQTAQHVAVAVKALHSAYPAARFIDAESPTSLPALEWRQTLPTWLKLFSQKSGVPLYGMAMDVVWSKPWEDAARATATMLRDNDVVPGIFLNTTGNAPKSPQDWIDSASKNACSVSKSGIPIELMIVANWNLPSLSNLPESDRSTLAAFANVVASGAACNP